MKKIILQYEVEVFLAFILKTKVFSRIVPIKSLSALHTFTCLIKRKLRVAHIFQEAKEVPNFRALNVQV